MDSNQAKILIKNIYGEAVDLNPSTLIQLFEIDISDLGFDQGVISDVEISLEKNTIFRFHNSIKSTSSSIIWQGKEYIALPIMVEGFEINSRGTIPTPKLRIEVPDEAISYLSIFKNRINQLGDLVGAKVTRIRTFAKFLDAENFLDYKFPDGFNPSNTELPRDIYYIDNKSLETKNVIEYQLSAFFDIQGLKLPGRLVIAKSCSAIYRGCGCLYEYNSRRISETHGNSGESVLPTYAPPIANDRNEKFSTLLSGISIVDMGEYQPGIFQSGNAVYITRNNLNYYFICKDKDVITPPPNLRYWIPDSCSKQVLGCELRYGINGSAEGNVTPGNLMYNGFISVNDFR